jgi:Icc-related predicted phosphoesterase
MPGRAVLTIVCVSDTHGHHDATDVPAGDVLIHAGDLTMFGTPDEVDAFDAWLGNLPHRHKVVVAGNHDWCFQRSPAEARRRLTNAIYLEDESAEVAGLKVYGSPWQPWFLDWAFNLQRGPELAAKWALIPADTDVLVTHGPPEGIGDLTRHWYHVGDADLLERVQEVKPKLHVFGHIHEAGGVYPVGDTLFVNAATHMGVGAAVVVRMSSTGEIEAG